MDLADHGGRDLAVAGRLAALRRPVRPVGQGVARLGLRRTSTSRRTSPTTYFSEPATGVNIWQGDSLQVAATSGVPGSSAAESSRLGRTGTTSTEPRSPRSAPSCTGGSLRPRGQRPGDERDRQCDQGRRRPTPRCTSWRCRGATSPRCQPTANTVFSFSALLNDKDSGVRKGYLQWGDGIGANKDVGRVQHGPADALTGAPRAHGQVRTRPASELSSGPGPERRGPPPMRGPPVSSSLMCWRGLAVRASRART